MVGCAISGALWEALKYIAVYGNLCGSSNHAVYSYCKYSKYSTTMMTLKLERYTVL